MTTAKGTVLVVEDDGAMRLYLKEELETRGYVIETASEGREALHRLHSSEIDVVVTDLQMPGMKGLELLQEIRSYGFEIPVIIITAFGTIDTAVEATKAGAYHFVTKPFRIDQLLISVENAMRERDLKREIQKLRSQVPAQEKRIIAESPAMRWVLNLAARAAGSDAPVLILGESGTGKEVLARFIHREGPRRERPYVAVNCSAIPETLLESQLFGHRRGAFTDAKEDRRGLFQEAQGGTIFLDEIGDMPTTLQGKILRVLQEGEVHALGAPAPVPVDARVIAATHRDLEGLISEGRFRQDLYYRLNVVAIQIPPLRDRPEDLIPLVAHFLETHGSRFGRVGCTLSPEVFEAFRRHGWPGNVRELENAIERSLVLGAGPTLRLNDMPDAVRRPPSRGAEAHPQAFVPRTLEEVERDHIAQTVRSVGGNKAAAARILGLDRKTLYRKMQTYGLTE